MLRRCPTMCRPRFISCAGALIVSVVFGGFESRGQLPFSSRPGRSTVPPPANAWGHDIDNQRWPEDELPTIHRVYFPPNPPPLGVEVAAAARGKGPARSDAPEVLSDYVGEHFYAPLSSRLAARQLPPAMVNTITEYLGLRTAFLAELREHIYGIKDADAATRLRLNAELARVQTPKLVALEASADQIRRDLYHARALGRDEFDWNELRQWKLGAGQLKRPREENAVLEYQVQRAATYFQDGLSPAQRRLLREVAMETEDRVFRSNSPPVSEYGFMFFSPETARVRLPSGLPEEVIARLDGFDREKAALKTELRDAIYAADSHRFISYRAHDLEELARKQSARLAGLEELAEDIRRELVKIRALTRPQAPNPLPELLGEMVGQFKEDRGRLQRDLIGRVQAAHASIKPPASRDPADQADYRDRLSAATEQVTKKFEEESLGRFEQLQRDLEAIVAFIEKLTSEDDEILQSGSAESIVTAFMARQRKLESAFEYHTALFEPGLSPEQRRLLFGAAIRLMELPLPGSELQPTALPGTLIPVGEIGR